MTNHSEEEETKDRLLAQQLLKHIHNVADIVRTRKYISLLEEQFSEYENKVIIAQSAVRRFLALKELHKRKTEHDEHIAKIVRVQSIIRRFLAIKNAVRVRSEREERERMIIRLQSHVRGFLARKGLLREVHETLSELELLNEAFSGPSPSRSSIPNISTSLSSLTANNTTFIVSRTSDFMNVVRSIRSEIQKLKAHNADHKFTLEQLKEMRRNKAAVTIQRYWRGYWVREQLKEEIKDRMKALKVYMDKVQLDDTSLDVKIELPATTQLDRYTDMLFASILYRNKVAAVRIDRIISLSSILCKYFVERCEGLSVVLDRMSQMDRSPGEEEIITALTAVIQTILDSVNEPVVKEAVLKDAELIFKTLFHASYAFYQNEEIVKTCAIALVALKSIIEDMPFKSAKYYITQADKRYNKLPDNDLKKMSLQILKEVFMY